MTFNPVFNRRTDQHFVLFAETVRPDAVDTTYSAYILPVHTEITYAGIYSANVDLLFYNIKEERRKMKLVSLYQMRVIYDNFFFFIEI